MMWDVFGLPNDENGVPGPIREDVGIEPPKNAQIIKSVRHFWRAFWRLVGTFREVVF